MGEAAKKLDLKSFDFAIPIDFSKDMHAIAPGHWAGVWGYDPHKGTKTIMGYPRPLTDEALEMLKKFNAKYKTQYYVDFDVLSESDEDQV